MGIELTMPMAKSSGAMLAVLALLTWGAVPLPAQNKPPAKAAQPSNQPQPGKAPAASNPAAGAPAQAKPPARVAQKTPPAKARTAQKPKRAAPPKARPAGETAPERAARRDPFNPLVGQNRLGGEALEHLPPGKAGLMVSTLRVDGLVRGPNGMIAVVSNPRQRVYFLHEGDQLYDGRVERITMDLVAFHEVGKDAFGQPIERQVIKRLYPSPGEMR